MPRLYCYVDESGTGSRLFSVAVVVVYHDKDELADTCQQIEHDSGKGRIKWSKSNHDKRMAYLRAVVDDVRFKDSLCFVTFDNISDHDMATIVAISRAIEHADPQGEQKISVFVDGLNEKKKREYSAGIRARVSSFVDVRGVPRDESNALIRLADAVAGFVQDVADEESRDVMALFQRAQRLGAIVKV
jgi:hypothetical protein